jgi:poly(glycerol-phosphate) alpha-glucosyltransferase
VDHAISAFRRVVDKVPPARLEIYGRGVQAPALQAQIEELGLHESVRLMGFSPDARRRLTTASASILTSRHEGQPLAVLESLAAGCPVVAYAIKYGPADMIIDGEHGFLVPDGDIDAVADRVVRILTDRTMAERMSRNARERARSDFGELAFVRRWGAVFDSVARQRPRMTDLESMSVVIDANSFDAGVQRVRGRLTVTGTIPEAAAGDVTVLGRVHAADSVAREYVEVPARSTPLGGGAVEFDLEIDAAIVRAQLPEGTLAASIVMTWNNCSFRAPLPLLDAAPAASPETG